MRTNVFQVAKAVAAAVIISLLFVLAFTVVIQLFSLPLSCVKPVNQVFKILSVAAGGLIFIRGEKGLIKGLIYGVAAVVATYFLYAAIAHSISLDWKFAAEIALGAAAGAISGIIAVNIKRKS